MAVSVVSVILPANRQQRANSVPPTGYQPAVERPCNSSRHISFFSTNTAKCQHHHPDTNQPFPFFLLFFFFPSSVLPFYLFFCLPSKTLTRAHELHCLCTLCTHYLYQLCITVCCRVPLGP